MSEQNSATIKKDSMTLAFLHPTFMDNMKYHIFKDSLHLHGSYRMNLRRPNRQPEHAREYQHGDPIRLIDWKAFAKHEQLIIREIQDDAASHAVIAVDYSDTMHWPTDDFEKITTLPYTSKMECALRTAMSLAYAHVRGGDQVSLIYFKNGLPQHIFKPRSSTDIVATFERMVKAKFQKEHLFLECIQTKVWPQKTDRFYYISDLLSYNFLDEKLKDWPIAKHRIIYHLLSHLEENTEWMLQDAYYHDEFDAAREYQGRVLLSQNAYDSEINKWKDQIKAKTKNLGIHYANISDTTPVQTFLHTLQTKGQR